MFAYHIDATQKSGGLTLGGVDLARFSGPLYWSSIEPTTKNNEYVYWKLGLTGINVGGTVLSVPSSIPTIIDTGTSLVTMPLALAEQINLKAGLQKMNVENSQLTYYGMDCFDGEIPRHLPNISLTVGNAVLTVDPTTYMFRQPDNLGRIKCLSGIAGTAANTLAHMTEESVLIGNVMLRQFYTVFDYEGQRIAFANGIRDPNLTPEIVTKLEGGSKIVGKALAPEVGNVQPAPAGSSEAKKSSGWGLSSSVFIWTLGVSLFLRWAL
jgi:hypothetical protein